MPQPVIYGEGYEENERRARFFAAIGDRRYQPDGTLSCRECNAATQPLVHVDIMYELEDEAVAIVAEDICVSCYALWVYPRIQRAREAGATLTKGILWPFPL